MAEFDRGAAQVGSCRSHDSSIKEPGEECGQDPPPSLYVSKKENFDAPYHNSVPSLFNPSYVQRGMGAAVEELGGGHR